MPISTKTIFSGFFDVIHAKTERHHIFKLLLLFTTVFGVHCGARTALPFEEKKPPIDYTGIECLETDDCPDKLNLCTPQRCYDGKCVVVSTIDCDDKDDCTKDICDPATGQCSHPWVTLDLDGDGYRAALPGTRAGEPGSCGDDCDDTSALAHPGIAQEICDGVDNDCNGIVDDHAIYTTVQQTPSLISDESLVEASGGNVAYAGKGLGYIATYSGENTSGDSSLYLRRLDETGLVVGAPTAASATTGDANTGAIIWTGDRYGVTWSDRRTGNYEVYFNTFSPDSVKTGPDIQLTNNFDFSIRPTIGWNGSNFYVVYQDDSTGFFVLYGRSLSLDGVASEEIPLIDYFEQAESPALAVNSEAIALAYFSGDSSQGAICLRRFGPQWQNGSTKVTLDEGDVESPAVAFNNGDMVVVWTQGSPFRVMGAVVSSDNEVIVPAQQLSIATGYSRFAQVLAFGDKIMVLYSHQEPGGDYNIIAQFFSPELTPIGDYVLLVSNVGNDRPASAIFGPQGDLAVLYESKKTSATGGLSTAVYMTRMLCSQPLRRPLTANIFCHFESLLTDPEQVFTGTNDYYYWI